MRSEDQLRRELHDAGARAGRRRAESAQPGIRGILWNETRNAGDTADGRGRDAGEFRGAHIGDVGVVESVEGFHNAELGPLSEPHCPSDAWIEGNSCGHVESIAAETGDTVCSEITVVVQVETHEPRIGLPGLGRQDPADLPATQHGSGERRQVVRVISPATRPRPLQFYAVTQPYDSRTAWQIEGEPRGDATQSFLGVCASSL